MKGHIIKDRMPINRINENKEGKVEENEAAAIDKEHRIRC